MSRLAVKPPRWHIAPLCAAIPFFAAPVCMAGDGADSTSPQVCARAQFSAVVDDAAAALRTLNQDNRPTFQTKLAQLRKLKGWDHPTFLKEAEPFVRDDRIDAFDHRINDHLRQISQLGDAGRTAKAPDCGLLSELQTHMAELVKTQSAKWVYMLEKLEKAIEDAS